MDFSNPKCVTNAKREELMISKSPILYQKGTLDFDYEKVTGIQLFSKNNVEKTVLEIAEENDLMRFVENGIKAIAIESRYKTIFVDTPKDLDAIKKVIGEKYYDK